MKKQKFYIVPSPLFYIEVTGTNRLPSGETKMKQTRTETQHTHYNIPVEEFRQLTNKYNKLGKYGKGDNDTEWYEIRIEDVRIVWFQVKE